MLLFYRLKQWLESFTRPRRPPAVRATSAVERAPIRSPAPLPQPVSAEDEFPKTMLLAATEDESDLDFAPAREVDPQQLQVLEALYAGIAYLHGFDREKDPRRAAACLKIAADAGSARARFLLGQLILELPGEAPARAIEYLAHAAEQGQVEAFSVLGLLFEEGKVVPADYRRAVECYARGADAGCATSNRRLGLLYVRESNRRAVRLEGARRLGVAAESGDVEAQYALSVFYSRGVAEDRDLNLALMWATRAAGAGHAGAPETVKAVLQPEDPADLKAFERVA